MHLGGRRQDAATADPTSVAPATTARGKMKFKDYDPIKPDTLLQNEQPTTLEDRRCEHSRRIPLAGPLLRDRYASPTGRSARWRRRRPQPRSTKERRGSAELCRAASSPSPAKPADVHTTAAMSSAASTHHANDDTWLNQGGVAYYSNDFTSFPNRCLAPADGHGAAAHGGHCIRPSSWALGRGDLHRRSRAASRSASSGIGATTRPPTTAMWARVIQPWAGNRLGRPVHPARRHRGRRRLRRCRPRPADRRRRVLQRPRQADLPSGRQDQVRASARAPCLKGGTVRLQRIHLRRQEGQ